MMTVGLQQTPLYNWHAAHGGRLVDFAGWSMPVQYTSIVAEHEATRGAVGLFDISHMGRLKFTGPEAARFLDSLVTRDTLSLKPGRIRYALMTREDGGILDDVLVYHLTSSAGHLTNAAGESYRLLVVNAGNREKIVRWIQQHMPATGVTFEDQTHELAMIAVQGPRSVELVQPLTELPLAGMKYYSGAETTLLGSPATVSRTGYTGEDGFELIVPAAAAPDIWQRLLADGESLGARPCGLGCRDTLRLEAAMPLYGHELSEAINPLEAGLAMAVDLDKADYPGREALRSASKQGATTERVGLRLEGKRIAREGSAVLHGEEAVGLVTSGSFSPTLNCPIAMAYIPPKLSTVGTPLRVDIRGSFVPAEVVPLPFYRR